MLYKEEVAYSGCAFDERHYDIIVRQRDGKRGHMIGFSSFPFLSS